MKKTRLSDRITHRLFNVLKIAGYRLSVLPNRFQLYSPIKIYELETVLAYLSISQSLIVDVCCGTGIQSQLLSRRGCSVVGIDCDPKKIRDADWHLRYSKANGSVSFLVGRAEELPLQNCIADAVLCLCAIEHISYPAEVLSEIARILKPGGKLYMTADSLVNVANVDLKARHQKMYCVHRYYDVASLSDAIENAGLHVENAFPILCSAEAVGELERSMSDPSPYNPLTAYRVLNRLRKSDGPILGRAGGLFVFAVAVKNPRGDKK